MKQLVHTLLVWPRSVLVGVVVGVIELAMIYRSQGYKGRKTQLHNLWLILSAENGVKLFLQLSTSVQ